jgi:ADP-heptose:LPS heptosyltransferase
LVKEIIIIRLSAIGDVALCLPLIQRILTLNSDANITIVTKPQTAFIFKNIDRLHVVEAQVESKHKGIIGLWQLAKEIKAKHKKIYAVIDLHNVLRSKILKFLLQFSATKSSTISKNRSAKKHIISSAGSKKATSFALPHITEVYAKAIAAVGLKVDTRFSFPAIRPSKADIEIATKFFLNNGAALNVAIAPFAKHQSKVLPWEKTQAVVAALCEKDIHVYMYGGLGDEAQKMQTLADMHPQVKLLHNLNFAQQIALLNYMQCMLSMDSANMHFASLQGVPLVSVWGSTNTQTGFGPLDVNATIIEISKQVLPCRPCSVYGNKACHLQNNAYACLHQLQVSTITHAIFQKLGV